MGAIVYGVVLLLLVIGAIIIAAASVASTQSKELDPRLGPARIRVEGPRGKVFKYSWQVYQQYSIFNRVKTVIVDSGTATTKDRAIRKAEKFIRNSQVSVFDYPALPDGTIDRKTLEQEQWNQEFQQIAPERNRT